MTASALLQASQGAAGAPIQITGVYTATSSADDSAVSGYFLAVTTANTPPATFAGAAHTDGGALGDAYWDSTTNPFNQTIMGGVTTSYNNRINDTVLQRVDSNYVAGRYLWFTLWASATPAGGDAPIAVSASYHIR